MPDISIFKIENLIKWSRKGKISKLYDTMYKEAEKIAAKETKKFIHELVATSPRGRPNNPFQTTKMLFDYHKKRLQFHIDRMEKLLEMSLKHQSEQQK